MAKRVGKPSAITKRLADLIDDDERSQAVLAEALHRSRTALSEWKAGRSEPDLETFAKLCGLLGTSADAVLGLAPPSPVTRRAVEAALVRLDEARALLGAETRQAPAIAERFGAVAAGARKGRRRPRRSSG